MAYVDPRFGARLKELREERGISLRHLAPRILSSKSHICDFEAGRCLPSPSTLQRLDDALQAGGELIALAAGNVAQPEIVELFSEKQLWDHGSTGALMDYLSNEARLEQGEALRLAHEWRIVDPPQVVHMAAGRRIGHRLAQSVAERTDMLRRMDDYLGGGDMHDLVRRELMATLEMVKGASYTETTGRHLLSTVGELCQLAGWVASDAGLHLQAERYYLGGVSAAHAAQNHPLSANLLSSLAYQKANIADPREAALLATSAYQGAHPSATLTTRTLLLERVAWASARLGDIRGTLKSLEEVDELFSGTQPDEDPSWVYWVTRDEIDVMAGRCFTELRRPANAIPLLTRAVQRYDGTHERELSLYLSWLAEAHIYSENIEAAADAADHCLTLSANVTSARGVDRVRHLRRLLRPYRGNVAVDGFEDHAVELLGIAMDPDV